MTSFAALRHDSCELRSRTNSLHVTAGLTFLIFSTVSASLAWPRPAKISSLGEAIASEDAVDPPMPPGFAPVIRMILSLACWENASTTICPPLAIGCRHGGVPFRECVER